MHNDGTLLGEFSVLLDKTDPEYDHYKSGHPESNQGPSDVCSIYSQMLYQLSYSRNCLFLPCASREPAAEISNWRVPRHAASQ